jgi:site-specific recombinase XerC
MLVLANCAGLRLGEIVRLTIGDIRMEEGVIEVRETKFFKTRHLPLSPSAVAAMRSYLAARKQAGGTSDDDSVLFWQQQDRCGYADDGGRLAGSGVPQRWFESATPEPSRGPTYVLTRCAGTRLPAVFRHTRS